MKNKIKKPVIIDTDPGHDDALAIILLEKSGLADIKAVTTVAGNSSIENVTNNARYILDLVGCSAPIFSGADRPLNRDLIRADVHGLSGLDGAKLTKNEPLNGLAVDKIIEIVKENPGKVSLVIIGPETNIAKAIQREPDLPKLAKEFIIMGGAINCAGNKNRTAEFNIFVDPEAAEIVFNSGARITLIPLDICNEIILTLKDFQSLKGRGLYGQIMSMMRKYIKGILKFENVRGALVYDALATYYLINPGAYTLTRADIRIETKGEYTRGMSVMDKRGYGKKNYNINLVTKINQAKFRTDFVKILSR
jgi:inosine-uridine nucleoside N-ribohydrolase